MKKLLRGGLALLCTALLVLSCRHAKEIVEIHVSSISLGLTEIELESDGSIQLIVTIQPKDATFTDVEWTSSDITVATVSSEGIVKAVNEGTAVITANKERPKNFRFAMSHPAGIPTAMAIKVETQACIIVNSTTFHKRSEKTNCIFYFERIWSTESTASKASA